MELIWMAALIVLPWSLIRIAESRLHSANYRFLSHLGAEELIPEHMHIYYRLNNIVLPAALAEAALVGNFVLDPLALFGMGILILGSLVKIWSIWSLGRFWTMRCVCISGLHRVKDGPFRFLEHPEYVARFLEVLALMLIFKAWWIGSLALIVTSGLALAIVRTENRQIWELSDSTY